VRVCVCVLHSAVASLFQAAMGEEEGDWKRRLCIAICAPPIPRINFDPSAPSIQARLNRFNRGIVFIGIIGFARSYLNAAALLGDFMHGGTDFFAALIGFGAIRNWCFANGSFLVAFMAWASFNAILFDLIFSMGPNILYHDIYTTGGTSRQCAFYLDNILLILNAGMQLRLFMVAKSILDEMLPDWQNMVTYGRSGGASGPTSLGQPLLPGRSTTSTRSVQAADPNFVPFSGSGNRMGATGSGSGSRNSRLL